MGERAFVTTEYLSRMLDSIAPTTSRSMVACNAVIILVLGQDWHERHIMAPVRGLPSDVGYVGFDFSETEISKLKQHRVYDFAEMLLNLQVVPGFRRRVDVWRTWPESDVESMFAEMQAASLLRLYNVDFRFVDKAGKPSRGENYDFEVYKNDERIFAEAKCKFEDTNISANSIFESLSMARKQVPRYGPSVIFVKIPEQWFQGNDVLSPEIERVTRRFLGGTERVMSVVYHTPFHTFDGWRVTQRYNTREVQNHKCRFRDKTTSVFDGFEAPRNPAWVRLGDIIEGIK